MEKNSPLLQIDKELIGHLEKLPDNFWDFKKEDTKAFTHGIHMYPAMMVSPISKYIIQLVSSLKPVQALYDPFAGSGTVLVEGTLANINNVCGTDINPLALLLARVKTSHLDSKKLAQILFEHEILLVDKYERFAKLIANIDGFIQNDLGFNLTDKKGWGDDAPNHLRKYWTKIQQEITFPEFKNIGYWFRPKVIIELSLIKFAIEQIKDIKIKEFFLVAFSETVRIVSNRRNGEFKMYRMQAEKVLNHEPDVRSVYLSYLKRNAKKMYDYNKACKSFSVQSDVSIYKNNACQLVDVNDNFFDLVVTSPPYGDSRTTVAYGEYSRLSLQWMNLYNLSNQEITRIDKSLMGGVKFRNGFEYSISSSTLKKLLDKIAEQDLERAGDVYSFYKDLDEAIKQIATKTKIGGYHFWVVGNRTVKGQTLATDKIITEIAQQYSLQYIYTMTRNIPNKSMPLRNSPTNKAGKHGVTMTNEYIVILRKA